MANNRTAFCNQASKQPTNKVSLRATRHVHNFLAASMRARVPRPSDATLQAQSGHTKHAALRGLLQEPLDQKLIATSGQGLSLPRFLEEGVRPEQPGPSASLCLALALVLAPWPNAVESVRPTCPRRSRDSSDRRSRVQGSRQSISKQDLHLTAK